MSEDERINEILITIQKIKDSKEPTRRYFINNYVPFSQAQYYNYCKILKKYGEEGLKKIFYHSLMQTFQNPV
jgi:hypothetical protein